MKKLLVCLMLALAGPALAQDANSAGSNIGLSQYPAPTCSKPPPLPPVPEPTPTDKANPADFNAKVRRYNSDVTVFNTAMKTFNDCMRVYVENGNADMRRIKAAMDAGIAAANAQ